MTSSAAGAAAGGAFLQIREVVKDFDGFKAVDRVSLDIARGEIFALLGSSGCGKSTLLRMLAGFEEPSAGQILLDGKDLAGLPPYQRPINMMFQSYALFPHLTVWDNIAFGLRREGMSKDKVASRVEAMLKLGARSENISVLLGPAVSGPNYEVPEEMAAEVEGRLPGSRTTTSRGTPALDLRAGIARQLNAVGIRSIDIDPRCTVADPALFSHRRGAPTGRLASLIWME